ncbi:hypothetical protein WBG78_08320 [Chryseolinea sp. T2]|uniref:hypothetical protein n=1 Tax=Chryseolinea sp. T2 TaxID=3129255 RepID=UPI003076BA63
MTETEDLPGVHISELHKRKNTLRTLLVIWTVILIILGLTAIFITLKQGYSVFTVLPVVFLPGLIVSKRKLDLINVELKRRNP